MIQAQRKLKSTQGTARLVVLMAVIAIVLAAFIIVPMIINTSEQRLLELDEEYITAAKRLIREEYAVVDKDYIYVYDSQNKKFVETEYVRKVPEYANAKANRGKYVVVTIKASKGGEVTAEWMAAEDIVKIADKLNP